MSSLLSCARKRLTKSSSIPHAITEITRVPRTGNVSMACVTKTGASAIGT
ncbi:hypothetical protein AB4Z27_21680 [Cupriavidus sp. KB_39]